MVWTPDPSVASRTRLAEFASSAGFAGRPYPDLLAWSLAEPDAFWRSFADWIGVRWHDRPTAGLADASMPGAVWFPGGTLNHAEHALAFEGTEPAVVSRSQTRATVVLTRDELRDAVARCRAGLVRLGVGRGDRVAAFLPNVHETIVAFLATASLGAVWSSCAPEFGARAVIDRWSDDRSFQPQEGIVVINPNERIEYREKISTRDMKQGQAYEVEAMLKTDPDFRLQKPLTPR